jgi:methylenetetrahydrofolate dehydrogenase (NADP+) / methenyltetrahydrofolate cyclohydrolase
MSAEIVDGKKIAEKIRRNVAFEIQKLKSKYNIKPNITTIKIGSNPESDIYLKLRDTACEKVGIKSNHISLPENVSEKETVDLIIKQNEDKLVHGILIQFPIPLHLSSDKLINVLNPKKDVEGLTPLNMGLTLRGDEYIIPCTSLAVLKILEEEKIRLQGKNVVIINHSNIVGKPLSALFLNRNSTVSVTHVFTKDLKDYTSKADILVTAAGVPKLIKKEHVKTGCFVIDVGIIKTANGITGDVDFEEVKEIAGKITPVPGGVGPVTVACSLVNMAKTFKNCIEK